MDILDDHHIAALLRGAHLGERSGPGLALIWLSVWYESGLVLTQSCSSVPCSQGRSAVLRCLTAVFLQCIGDLHSRIKRYIN